MFNKKTIYLFLLFIPLRLHAATASFSSIVWSDGSVQVSSPPVTSVSGTIFTATFSSQISTVNWNNGSNQYLTLTGTTTISFSNPSSGGHYLLILKQDSTGGRTVTWPVSVLWPGGITPGLTATASKIDAFALFYDSIDLKYIGDITLNH